MRIFISIDIPEKIVEEIKNIQKQLPSFEGKLTRPENLHLTLKFLGELGEGTVEKVKERLELVRMKKFFVELGLLGIFSERFPRIVWVYIKDCTQLQKEVDRALEVLFSKEKRFMSHITIARMKSVRDRKEFLKGLRKIKVRKMGFEVGSFQLKKSELSSSGPSYSVLKTYSLFEI